MPSRVNEEDICIDEKHPVAVKVYEPGQHPSPYQFYSSELAVFNIEERDVLIMDFIDGFHINPDLNDTTELRKLTFAQAADIAWQLIIGLNHFHYNNISGPAMVHGDVKGDNIKVRIKEVVVDGIKRYKIDTFYLDCDYVKLIQDNPQRSQGTAEHLPIEVLDGYYTEAGDFFSLSPVLLSLFGAHNPLRTILQFRNSHLHMEVPDLVRHYQDIGFCTDGLFEHFDEKPEQTITQLLEQFIGQMSEKNKANRPAPDVILEFFTALRQLTLVEKSSKERDIYLLRLYIAAHHEDWLNEKKYQNLFLQLDEHLKVRLILLMNLKQSIHLYQLMRDNKEAKIVIDKVRQNIANHLEIYSRSLTKPSLLRSFFLHPVKQKEIQWLLNCYKTNDSSEYYSSSNDKLRQRLLSCSEKELSPLIIILSECFTKPQELATLPNQIQI